MTQTISVSTVIHTPEGPVWLSVGDPVADSLLPLIPEGFLVADPPPVTPEPVEVPAPVVTDPEPVVEEDKVAPGIPYAGYPVDAWREYAKSLGLNPEGLSKPQLIRVVGTHFRVDVTNRKPSEIVADIHAANQ